MAEFCPSCALKMGFEPETLDQGEICEGCGATGPVRNYQLKPWQIAVLVIFVLSTLIAAFSCKEKPITADSINMHVGIDSLKVAETVETYLKAHSNEFAGYTDLDLFIRKLDRQWVAVDQANYYQKIASFAAVASQEAKRDAGYNPQDSKSDEITFSHMADSITKVYRKLDTQESLGIRVEASYKILKPDRTISNEKHICFYLDSNYHIIDKSKYLDFTTIPVYPAEDANLFFN